MRLQWIDVARGLAIVMVVTSHAISWTGSAQTSALAAWIYTINSTASIPLFFFVSGALFAPSLKMSRHELLLRKVAPLIWVFLVWQPVVFGYKYLAALTLPGQQDTSLVAHLARLLAFPVRPSGELWFLWALAIYMILAHATQSVPPLARVIPAAAMLVFFLSVLPQMVGPEMMRLLGPGLRGTPAYFVFFLAGLSAAPLLSRIERTRNLVWVAGFGVWISVVVSARLLGLDDHPALIPAWKVLGLVGALSLALLLRSSAPFALLGRSSMHIYLTNTTVIVSVLVAGSTVMSPPWGFLPTVATILACLTVALTLRSVTSKGHLTWLVQLPRRLTAGVR